ncbi:AraC family transcriptional regulator [bacterium C-53]|nr:AraC family transcriptional regulator [Lachnospiraceae bacterium]NBI03374.1 AraC family transcriptional regulator [Lachnospiraceae bacterium]RKJ09908.1 AraC family transcriptional regulator [bacterium C-53]
MAENTFKSNFIVQDRQMVSLSVYNVGLQKCESGHLWGPGVRDHFLIHYVVSGKGFYEVNGNTYTLTAGDSFLVYPYTEISYYADKDEPWEYYWVGFAGTDAAAILSSTDFSKKNPIIHAAGHEITESTENPAADDRMKQLLLSIYDARGNGLENSVEMTGRLYTTLAYFIKLSKKTPSGTDTYDAYTKKALEYITANYSYPITVEEIANYVGISRSHLFRAFQSILSVSPKEYLSDFRIRQACVLLKSSDLSVMAIARSVGFENNLYFSKAFRKIKGMTPSEYKEHVEQK